MINITRMVSGTMMSKRAWARFSLSYSPSPVVGIHQHVLGVPALCLNSCALHVGTEHSASTLAPFAAPAGGLNPSRTHAVADVPRRDAGSHGDDLAHWLVA